jgi:hypothetical protein
VTATKEKILSIIPRPATQKEMIDQLWFAIVGSNGDGIATKVRDTHDRVKTIETILPTLVTCEDLEKREAEKKAESEKLAKAHERRRLRPFDKWMLLLTAGTMLFIGIEAMTGLITAGHENRPAAQEAKK